MLPALLIVSIAFLALTLLRVGGARRRILLAHWPVIALGALATYFLARGAWVSGLSFAAAAALVWLQPEFLRRSPSAAPEDQAVADARALLGVGPGSSRVEIRAAFRRKMREAHPDRGGTHEHAARLAAARDLLLRL